MIREIQREAECILYTFFGSTQQAYKEKLFCQIQNSFGCDALEPGVLL